MNLLKTPGVSLMRQISRHANKTQSTNSLLSTHSYRYITSSSFPQTSNLINLDNKTSLINPNQSSTTNIINSSTNINTSNRTIHTLPTNLINATGIATNKNNNKKHNFKNVVISKRNQHQSFLLEHVYGLVFLGAPGVGKGTYSTLIAKEFGAKVLSSGDLIRACAKENKGTALGNSLTEYINSGQLVPDDIVIPMVVDYLRMLPSTFILDGFPRTLAQAKRIHNEYEFHCVLKFSLPDHILMQKILGRRICNNCGWNCNVADIDEGEIQMPSMAPKVDGICDKCGYELSTRPDDTEETVKARMKIFNEETGPIENFYRTSGLLVDHDIKKGIDDLPEIVNKLKTHLEQILRERQRVAIPNY